MSPLGFSIAIAGGVLISGILVTVLSMVINWDTCGTPGEAAKTVGIGLSISVVASLLIFGAAFATGTLVEWAESL